MASCRSLELQNRCVPESDMLAVEGGSHTGLWLFEARSLQTTFLSADLTKYHWRIYIYSEIFFIGFLAESLDDMF